MVFTGCLGASGIKLPKLDFDRVRVGNLRQLNGTRTWLGRRQVQYVGLTVSYEPKKVFSICCGPKLETECKYLITLGNCTLLIRLMVF